MKSNLILLLAAAIAMTACSKNGGGDPAGAFPMELKAVALESRGDVKLYTKSGEVKDKEMIANFIASEAGFNASFEPQPDNIITFMTDSTAQLGISAIRYKAVREGNDAVVFRSPFILGPAGPGEVQWTALDTYRLGKHNDPLQMFHSPGEILYKGEAVIRCEGIDESFLLPIMIYKLSRRIGDAGQASINVVSGKLFNEFNEDFLTTLGDKDTVAYQQSYVRYSINK
ncbi:hypothetical protein [Parapedobacter pyrenivorans]|uniref:hypothetical protein n=1 Tax=Parapedobacter pyrenivorans TaxID=1305674 RepID=UPI003341F541